MEVLLNAHSNNKEELATRDILLALREAGEADIVSVNKDINGLEKENLVITRLVPGGSERKFRDKKMVKAGSLARQKVYDMDRDADKNSEPLGGLKPAGDYTKIHTQDGSIPIKGSGFGKTR